MNESHEKLAERAADLRRAFDASFAEPADRPFEVLEDLLAVRVAGANFALRLREISGVVTHRQIVEVPSSAPALLGLAGLRGEVVPVFCLATLLGLGAEVESFATPATAHSWLVVCGDETPLALAFSGFDGLLQLPARAIHAEAGGRAPHAFVDEVATTPAGPRPLIRLPRLVAALRSRTAPARPSPPGPEGRG